MVHERLSLKPAQSLYKVVGQSRAQCIGEMLIHCSSCVHASRIQSFVCQSLHPCLKLLALIAIVGTICTNPGFSQELDTPAWEAKLRIHAARVYSPWSLAKSATSAAFLQEANSPREWGQGMEGYEKRLGSTLAYAGVRNTIAFGLDSTLRQDPRYYRSGEGGVWTRTAHAIRGTILTRTDSGAETFSTWRFGSAYSAAFISNQWRPDRVNTTMLSLQGGTTQIGFDVLSNIGLEFWPDVRKKMLRR